MNTDEMLRELAAETKPRDGYCNPCKCGEGEEHDGEKCPTCAACNCTGTVPAFPMLRVEPCDHGYHDSKNLQNHSDRMNAATHTRDCPGWRAKTLDEARLCLEELLVAETINLWYEDGLWISERVAGVGFSDGPTPTEAVLAALYEASKVEADA